MQHDLKINAIRLADGIAGDQIGFVFYRQFGVQNRSDGWFSEKRQLLSAMGMKVRDDGDDATFLEERTISTMPRRPCSNMGAPVL